MNESVSESRKAYHELLDLLREMDERYAGPEWGVTSPDDVAESLRAVLHLLEASLATRVESWPEHPWLREFPLPTRKFLGDNPDAVYFETAIAPGRSYRLAGNMAGAVYVSITIEAGAPNGEFSRDTAGVLNDTQFDVSVDGRFEIRIGGEPADRNWLALPEDASRITTRHYFEDERPAARLHPHLDFEIEALGEGVPPPRLSDGSVAASIRRVANFVRTSTLDMGAPATRTNQPDFVSRTPNQFVPATKPGNFALAAADAAYSMAPFVLAPDQALVMRGRWPEAVRCANVCLWNRHMQTFDYLNRQVSLNRKQTRIEADGSFRIVVAHEDPGVDNWLDTEGRPFGMVFWRYMLPEGDIETIEAEVVPVASLR